MIKGYLFGDRVVIFNINDARQIYALGYYGKPLGFSKPKKAEDINTPLELSLIEALYLVKINKLEVIYNNKPISDKELYDYSKDKVNRFEILYYIYSDLRNKGFVVRSGIKFGADFAVYTIGPGIEHAPYVVIAIDSKTDLLANELMSFGRVSHSTRKKLILGIIDSTTKNIRYIMFKWVKL
ncbi:tRNA-intron lyase [Acidianus sulfidivorans JP7]|uniref:tRNA-splicing endonuclease n=1 Tax=Acidianus sulfidivorans JP7 TaxID=619593 RepID=A0A2U9IMJ1_9CREN|nr:tRNA-intron lyase [Acidianus sulfidivorans]AWR97144.1 tRNA-intron lyase [Acidianus sulfidivorans JP7]